MVLVLPFRMYDMDGLGQRFSGILVIEFPEQSRVGNETLELLVSYESIYPIISTSLLRFAFSTRSLPLPELQDWAVSHANICVLQLEPCFRMPCRCTIRTASFELDIIQEHCLCQSHKNFCIGYILAHARPHASAKGAESRTCYIHFVSTDTVVFTDYPTGWVESERVFIVRWVVVNRIARAANFDSSKERADR